MLMGLKNMPAMIMQMINNLFMDMLDKGVVVFLDDILIYSTTVEEQFELLEKVFLYFCKHEFYCKLKKYSFLQRTTTFLGFDITLEGLCISDTKFQSQGVATVNHHIIGIVTFGYSVIFSKVY